MLKRLCARIVLPRHILAGQEAESAAKRYLLRQGLRLVTQNFRCRYGEIDLIMTTPEATRVFVEVRLRNHPRVSGAESVDRHKQRKLIRSAEIYLQRQDSACLHPCRFDIVDLYRQANGFRYRWIQNAFDIE